MCLLPHVLLFGDIVYYYQPYVHFAIIECPSAVCSHFNMTSNIGLYFYNKDGKQKGHLTDGLTPDEYVEKANQLIDPALHTTYKDIRKQVEQDCRGYPDPEIWYPSNVTEMSRQWSVWDEIRMKTIYQMSCTHLFNEG